MIRTHINIWNAVFESWRAHGVFLNKRFFSKCTKVSSQEKNVRVAYKLHTGCDPWTLRIKPMVSTAGLRLTWNTMSSTVYQYKQVYCSKTWLSHFRRARRFFFDDTRGLYQTAVNWIQHTFRTSRVLSCNSLGTPDLSNLSAIWISHGPWNLKFSAPSSQSSKLENCVHPPKIGLNLGFVRRKVFLRQGVRPAPVPFPLFLGL